MNLFLELQGQQDSTELNVNSIMKTYDTISRENDEIVASDISAQVENLQSKLEKRRNIDNLKD
jgi:hypothetical protein